MPFLKGHTGYRKYYTAKVENICTICGKREMRRPCEASAYCGAACYHQSRAGLRLKEITKPCARCGKLMTNYVSQIGKYCCRACADAAKIQNVTERFWKFVERGNDCWLWRGGVGTDGYGKFWIHRKMQHASRVSYELTHGPISDTSIYVCHTCDNPLCVRPDHLFLGTRQDNVADMVKKGRSSRGERHFAAKLTEADVVMIRAARSAGVTLSTIARRFGVSETHVHAVTYRRVWKHVV